MALKTTTQKSSPITHGQSRLDSWCWISSTGLTILIVLGIIAACQFIAPAGLAAQVNQDQIGDVIRDQNQPWRLEADEINYDQSFE